MGLARDHLQGGEASILHLNSIWGPAAPHRKRPVPERAVLATPPVARRGIASTPNDCPRAGAGLLRWLARTCAGTRNGCLRWAPSFRLRQAWADRPSLGKIAVDPDDRRLCAERLVQKSLQFRLQLPSKPMGQFATRADSELGVDPREVRLQRFDGGSPEPVVGRLDHRHSSATLMISLPRWSPVKSLISVSGKVSSPSTMCSRDLSRPLARQAANARVASASRAA